MPSPPMLRALVSFLGKLQSESLKPSQPSLAAQPASQFSDVVISCLVSFFYLSTCCRGLGALLVSSWCPLCDPCIVKKLSALQLTLSGRQLCSTET